MKEKAPQGGAIPESEGDSSNRADYKEKDNTVIRFPAYRPPGFTRNCIRCGNHYRLPWMAATIRDGREKVCPPCFVDSLQEGR
jgi:hypothetical protein